MSNRPAIVDARGNPIRTVQDRVPAVRGRYDAAQTNGDNARHWAEADALSARSANSAAVRLKLRTRARYEAANNSYARGIVSTLANDLIGSGPRLQLLTTDQQSNRAIEAAFMAWCDSIGLPEKLRTMRQARAVDGEAFLFLDTDPSLAPVQLSVRAYEADQVATPYPYPLDPLAVDGIRFDRAMRPIEYHLLRSHPGDDLRFGLGFEFDRVPAANVVHWFRPDRPQQYRGIPELTPALPLFAQLRRYTLAVLAAAETAADFAAVLYSDMPPDGETADAEPFESLDIERRMMTTLPAGWKMNQFKPEQPATTYEMFKREILNEIARSLNVPYNVAAGNSSSYNYSSGRLDHQTYYRSLGVDQSQLERVALEPIFAAWLAEAAMATDLIPGGADRPGGWPHRWLWPGIEHVDPEKEANAQEIRLRNLMTSFSDECQRQGVDPESRAQTIANDLAMFERLKIPVPAAWAIATPAPPPQPPGDGNADPTNAQGGRQAGLAFEALVHRNGHG